MSLLTQTKTTYSATCDRCGKPLGRWADSPVEFAKMLDRHDWLHRSPAQYYCPDCWELTIYDKIIIKDKIQ